MSMTEMRQKAADMISTALTPKRWFMTMAANGPSDMANLANHEVLWLASVRWNDSLVSTINVLDNII